jgi:hypothetical protein
MALNFALRPGDFEGLEHSEVSADVGSIGIEKRAVPIEENDTGGETNSIHDKRIVSDGRSE